MGKLKFQKADGRERLCKCLGWAEFDEEKDMQRSIHEDFLYDTLKYTAEKGFSWNKAATCANFADKLVQQIKECDRITDILGFYNSQASYLLESLGQRDYQIFSAYVFETVLPHFKLYQLVFNFPRAEQIPSVPVLVEPPFDVNTLKGTKPLNIWEYEQQIAAIERKEQERLDEIMTEKEETVSRINGETKTKLDKVAQSETAFDKEKLGSIIEEVMKGFTLAATESLKCDIEKLQDNLEFKLEKTSLPRPQVLGPPPRYSVQSVKQSPSKAKSPKPGSRASARSKKK
ncbi:uncharacterized protein C8orf74-like [Mya arenaria]|uniref:uncharacterized protein C8orf74-like n=1 Tax=Mya arenaria TaxID=6604 RepID=UPI0022E11584|nr:uncharacterized protein C8orf74-like [Mya arenaria]